MLTVSSGIFGVNNPTGLIHSFPSIYIVIFTHSSSWTAFFTSSEFIYFHSILLIIEVSNVILFLLTIYHLVKIKKDYYSIFTPLLNTYQVSHWRTTAQILDVEDRNNKLHFWIVLKLFMITGNPHRPNILRKYQHLFISLLIIYAGIPWIGEFFSHIILHAETRKGCDSFWIRLLLDICPLFAVSYIFAFDNV